MGIYSQEEMKFLYGLVKNKIITLPDNIVKQLECVVVEDPCVDMVVSSLFDCIRKSIIDDKMVSLREHAHKSVIGDTTEDETQLKIPQYIILITLCNYLNFISPSYHSKYKINSCSSEFSIIDSISSDYNTLQEKVDAIVKLYYTEWIKDMCSYEHKMELGKFSLSNAMLELSNNPHGGVRQLLKRSEMVNHDINTKCHLTTTYADADDSDYKVIPESLTKSYKK